MHLPTYLSLMAAAGLYGLIGLVASFFINKLLFAVGVFVLVLTAWGTFVQAANAEGWEIKWMLWYIVPAALMLTGTTVSLQEGQNSLLSFAEIETIQSIIPGRAKDYSTAARQHLLSMLFPLVAKGAAELVGQFIRRD